jgi:phosphonopyruvate decarboxylase
MIQARDFVEAARARGFSWYAGVPCSYLTPFINYVLQDSSLRYLSMANEGDAVALIAGVTLGATGLPTRRGVSMMQNSGLGNAVSPLTSLTWTFRLPQLLIVTWRGQPGVADEPQHALMGPITPQLLELMQIPWELFPVRREEIAPALERATRHMDSSGQPYALLMQKGTVAACDLEADPLTVARPPSHAPLVDAAAPPRSLVSREQALTQVLACTTDAATVVLASTGFCGRELFALQDRPSHFYMVGSMGCVSAIALGLALSRPDLRVVALDGDGAALMRMGTFATIGAYAPPNLWHLLLDNAVHDSTGGQSTVSRRLSFAGIAAACGYASALQTAELGKIAAWLEAGPLTGPRFACLLTRPGSPADLPRPTLGPVAVKERLSRHIGSRLDP